MSKIKIYILTFIISLLWASAVWSGLYKNAEHMDYQGRLSLSEAWIADARVKDLVYGKKNNCVVPCIRFIRQALSPEVKP